MRYIRKPAVRLHAVQVENLEILLALRPENREYRQEELSAGQGGLELEDGCEGGKHGFRLDVQTSNRNS